MLAVGLTLSLTLVPLLIALNAFFVAAEYALVALRTSDLETMRLHGARRTADAMARLKARPASSIGTIQVCITMTNLLLGWIGEPAMSQVLEMAFGPLIAVMPAHVVTAISTALAFLVVTLLTVVLSELLPKALTLQYVQPAARLTAVPVLAIQQALRPLVWLMNVLANAITRPLGLGRVDDLERAGHTLEEFRLITTEAAREGVLSPRERSLILNTLAMGKRTARDIMVPRVRVAYLDVGASMEANRQIVERFLMSRMPVCRGGLDQVRGVIHTKEFLSAYYGEGVSDHGAGDSTVLELIARPAVFAPATVSLDRLMTLFQEQRTQFIFLVDEHGGVEGIVTLQDVVDELVGEIREVVAGGASPAGEPANGSTATTEATAAANEGPFEVDGSMPIHELARRLNVVEWEHDAAVSSVGGLMTEKIGRIPLPGESTTLADGTTLRVMESDEKAVHRISVAPTA